MKNFELYIFNQASRASIYGIGSYLDQLILVLKRKNISFTVITFFSEVKEVEITSEDGYTQILIPRCIDSPFLQKKVQNEYYCRNVVYLLRGLIPDKPTNIFHLNFMTNKNLAVYLRKLFCGKIILSVHYTNWSFTLSGNYDMMIKMLTSTKGKIKNRLQQQVIQDYRDEKTIIKNCDHVVCIAKHSLDFVKKTYSLDDNQITLINYGLADKYKRKEDKILSRIKEKYHIPKYIKIIFFAGRLDEIKGVSHIIEAVRLIIDKFPDIQLFIAGDGDYNKYLNELSGIWSKATFTGRLDKDQLYEFYSIADIGVVSSIHEEFGLVVTEMMMHELPIIVSDTGGPTEQIVENISGLKVPIEFKENKRILNSNILAEKIQFMIENPDLAKEMGLNARKRYIEKYELSVFEKNIINLYQNI